MVSLVAMVVPLVVPGPLLKASRVYFRHRLVAHVCSLLPC